MERLQNQFTTKKYQNDGGTGVVILIIQAVNGWPLNKNENMVSSSPSCSSW